MGGGGGLVLWKLNSAHRGQRLPARNSQVSPISGQFRGCFRGGWGKRPGRTIGGLSRSGATGGGVLGITLGDIFSVCAPSWLGQIHGMRVAALRIRFRWKNRVVPP